MEFEALPCPEPLHNFTILSAPAFWILQNHYSLHVKKPSDFSFTYRRAKAIWIGMVSEGRMLEMVLWCILHHQNLQSPEGPAPKLQNFKGFQTEKALWPHILIKIISPSLNIRIGLGSAMEMIIMMSVGSACQIIH